MIAPKNSIRPTSPPAPAPAAADDDKFFVRGDDAAAAAGPAKPTPQPAAPSTPPAGAANPGGHSSLLVATARRAGLSDEEIAGASKEDILAAIQLVALDRSNERRLDGQKPSAASGDGTGGPDAAAQPTPRPTAPPADEIDWGEGVEDGKAVRYTDADIHPAILKVIKDQARRIAQLEGVSGQLVNVEVSRQQRTIDDLLDDAFEALPAGLQAIFGKGSINDLEKGGKEQKRRLALLVSAGIDTTKPPRIKELVRRLSEAAADLYPQAATADPPAPAGSYGPGSAAPAPAAKPTPPKDPSTGKFLPTADEWASAGSLTPTPRRHPAEKGFEKAVEAVAQKLDTLGQGSNGQAGGSIVDKFPE